MAGRPTADTPPGQPAGRTTFRRSPNRVELPNRSRRDPNDMPVYAPDGTYACGDPDCWSCWPEGAANTVGYSAGAACCPDETSARRHRDRATWWDADAKPEGGFMGPRWDTWTEQVVAHYRWQYGPRRRWTS